MAKKVLTEIEQLQADLAAANAATEAAEQKAAKETAAATEAKAAAEASAQEAVDAKADTEAAKQQVQELEEVVDGQTAELEKQSDQKKAGSPVITVGKSKYKVLVPKCHVPVDGELKTVNTADLSKKENEKVFDALMDIDGQAVLEELTA